jgi:hypothetical protein
MSLNVDSVEITQAYQGALAEAGGWYDIQSLRISDHELMFCVQVPAQVLVQGCCRSADARDQGRSRGARRRRPV